ncbi:DUF881 domain-containing protein [Actinoplanes sp. CA-051413]|uniref:DUF881 domain-containing protein n=1 Tax=Actinoplanes sp. CA-051413 TaxID=3239899 RepID=UPI003D95F918
MTDDQQPDRRDDRPDRPATEPASGERPEPAAPRPGRPAGDPVSGDRPPSATAQGDRSSFGGAAAEREAGERRGAGRPAALGDPGMPAAGRQPAAEATAPDVENAPHPYATADPHVPLSADGPTVRLSKAMLPPPAADSDGPPEKLGSAPADSVAAAGDESTVVSRPVRPDDEATTLLTPPPAAVDDEPTVQVEPKSLDAGPADGEPARRRSFDGGSTMRLQPPFFAPGTTRTPRATPVTDDATTSQGNPSWPDSSAGPSTEDGDRSQPHAVDEPPADHDDASWVNAAGGQGDDQAWTDHAGPPPTRHDESWPDTDDALPAPQDGQSWGAEAADGDEGREPTADASRDPAMETRERRQSSPADPDRWSDRPSWPADDASGHNDAPDLPGGSVSATKSAERDTPGRWQESMARAAAAADDQNSPDATPEDSPEPVTGAPAVPDKEKPSAGRRLSSAGALIWLLLALLGFTLAVQLRSNDQDAGLATARQEDLVGILSDLEARDQRLQQEINGLEESQRQLTSGVAGRQAALAEAGKRADELGLLSGTLPARGPGLKISIDPKGQPIKASAILNAVQELRGAGGEVMEIIGDNGVAVRIVASSYFVDGDGGQVIVDGKQLSGPYTLWVIGVPSTMQTALQIPGGVVASVSQAGGNVTMEQRTAVEVTAVRQPTSLQYARPVS